MAVDAFKHNVEAAVAPARDFFAVTLANTDLDVIPKALFIGNGGNVQVHNLKGEVITFNNVQDGQILPIQVKQVRTASTASNIVALA